MKKMAIFGFSANPPANHHILIVRKLIRLFQKVVIIPRGTDSNKPSTFETTPLQRKEMVRLAFHNLPNAELDLSDLDENVFTPTWMLDKKYKAKFPNSEIWYVIGGDIVKDGSTNNSEIHKKWQKGSEILETLNWAIIDHPNYTINPPDLPPHNFLIKMDGFKGRSTTVRNRVISGQPINGLIPPEIEEYIKKNNLYK